MTYLSETSRPSARRDLIDIQRNDPQLGIFAVQALSAKSWFQIDNNSIDNIFADMVYDVNLGRASIRSALRAAESKINVLMTKLENFKFKVLVCLLILSTFYFLLSTSVSAHTSGLWTPGEPLIPCGGDYTDGNGNVV